MSKKNFEDASLISTNYICGNCGTSINHVEWTRCRQCNRFHLCRLCLTIAYDQLPAHTRNKHQQHHLENPRISGDFFELISFDQVDADDKATKSAKRTREFHRIIEQGKITNDYEHSIIVESIQSQPGVSNDSLQKLILDYHLTDMPTTVNIISMNGGGKRSTFFTKLMTSGFFS